MNDLRLISAGIFILFWAASSTAQDVGSAPPPGGATSSDGASIHAYGDLYVHGVSPDLLPGNLIQVDNENPKTKVQPKKSWEIGHNMFGATAPRVPRTAQTDRQFHLPINLIDGDAKTYWISRGQAQPDIEPEWIRIDLPTERMIEEIVLLPRAEPLPARGVREEWGETARYYNPMPKKLTIKVSLDAWHWSTVHQTETLTPPKLGEPLRFKFPRRRVKQIWITGELFDLMVTGPFTDIWGHCWNLAEVQAFDKDGANWALAANGAGVTVSSIHYGYQGKRQELAEWWPLHYDLGLKWLRVAFWTSVLQWHYVEQEKGVYKIDPLADATITECHAHGIKVVMGLEYGNWLYTDTPKDNFEARLETMPFDPARAPWSDEQIEGYKNFVRFMVRHFKGRVHAWELWNEPLQDLRYGWGDTEEGYRKYAGIVQAIVPIIREEDPDAKIMASGTLGRLIDLVAPMIDIIDVVRFYEASLDDPYYRNEPAEVESYKEFVRSKGFKGDIFFSQENQWWGGPHPYPDWPGWFWRDKVETTELGQAKNLSRTMTRHAALGLVAFWNETWNTALTSGDVGLLRHGFNSGPSHQATVRAGYYVYRTLCTVLADTRPDPSLKVELKASAGSEAGTRRQTPLRSIDEIYDHWSFAAEDGSRLVALWMKGEPRDFHRGTEVDVTIDLAARTATGIDVLNGVEQPLRFSQENGRTRIERLQVYDYPLVLKLEE